MFNPEKNRYGGYIKIISQQGGQALFDRLAALVPCILFAFKEKLAWLNSRRKPQGVWGDWVSAAGAIERDFLPVGRLLDCEDFWGLALKCLLITGYEKLQASRPGLPLICEAAGDRGYVDDQKAIAFLNQLGENDQAVLEEMACEVSCSEMDFLFLLGGEIQEVFQKIDI